MDTNADRGRFGRTISRLRAFVERLGHASTGWIEQLSARRGIFLTSLLVGALAVLLAVFVSFPGTILYHSIFGSRISDTLKLSHNLFARDLQEDILAYRIVVPLLSRWTGTNQPWLLVIVFQWSALVLTLAINFLAIVRKMGKDGIRFAWPLTLALGLSFFTFWSYYGSGCFDAVTQLTLALALLISRPWLLALLALVGTLNDERFLIAAPFIVLWHVRGAGIRDLFRSSWRRIAALLFAVGAVALIRHGLTHGWWGPGISLPEVYRLIWQDVILGLKPFGTHSRTTGWLVFLVNVFMSFRWLWWVVIAFVLTPIPWCLPDIQNSVRRRIGGRTSIHCHGHGRGQECWLSLSGHSPGRRSLDSHKLPPCRQATVVALAAPHRNSGVLHQWQPSGVLAPAAAGSRSIQLFCRHREGRPSRCDRAERLVRLVSSSVAEFSEALKSETDAKLHCFLAA